MFLSGCERRILCKSVKNQGLGLGLVGLGLKLRLGLVLDIRRSGVRADSGRYFLPL